MAETEILEIDPISPQSQIITKAAAIIRRGGLVAFPTETVYGLGADATSEEAVRKIFESKGRPSDNPLIVHVGNRRMLDEVAVGISNKATELIERFWPGPLTLVLGRGAAVAPSVSAGLDTVAVRMPSALVALELIRGAATPIAAPSANASGRPSPTLARHVLDDLGGKVDLILDSGKTSIGIESTVIDMTADPPVILRPGWVTRDAISEVIGPVGSAASEVELRRSPGTRHRHYSPRARVILIERGSADFINQVCRDLLENCRVGYMGHTAIGISHPNFTEIIVGGSSQEYGGSMYSNLRRLDESNPEVIVVEAIDHFDRGEAVMDRLRRAATDIIAGDA
jgi:L-threonylcarbamoyladenylate synthase